MEKKFTKVEQDGSSLCTNSYYDDTIEIYNTHKDNESELIKQLALHTAQKSYQAVRNVKNSGKPYESSLELLTTIEEKINQINNIK